MFKKCNTDQWRPEDLDFKRHDDVLDPAMYMRFAMMDLKNNEQFFDKNSEHIKDIDFNHCLRCRKKYTIIL